MQFGALETVCIPVAFAQGALWCTGNSAHPACLCPGRLPLRCRPALDRASRPRMLPLRWRPASAMPADGMRVSSDAPSSGEPPVAAKRHAV